MPGLVRGMVRTAAVVGTATATRNAVDRHQAEKNAQAYSNAMNSVNVQQNPPPQQYYAPPPQQYAPPPQEQYAPPPQEDVISQLERLGTLKAQGLLTDEEFTAAKQKLLAG
jgi:hypothetical protein